MTFDQVIRGRPGYTTGFDYLRVGLSLAVLFLHVIYVSFSNYKLIWTSWCGPLERCILPMFFALSGFLVAGSLLRNTIPSFLALRALRILPALVVEITLSAIVIGFLFTKLRWADYLSSPEFYSYLLNIFGIVHFTLPGVFEGRTLNEQLWTLPFEFECYFTLAVVALFGIAKRRDMLALVLTAGTIAITIVSVWKHLGQVGPCAPGHVFISSFLFGVIIYLYKKELPHSKIIFFICLGASYIFLYIPDFVYMSAISLSYVTIYIGLLRLPKIPFGDLSYGIYLFHYPIARSIHEISGRTLSWEVLFPLTLFATLIFAFISWNLIENPALNRKAQVLAFVDQVSRWLARCLPRRVDASA